MYESNIPRISSDDSRDNLREQQSVGLTNMVYKYWEPLSYVLLILIAMLMRFWDLGSRAIGYDESLHAYYSFRLVEGFGFQHTPLMHGPFQFHGIAGLFFLFGDSDYVARLLSALFGTALVGIPYFLRHRLGSIGSLVAAIMLAFSPMMLFYSRYARNDIIMAVWTFVLVILLWRFVDEGKLRYLYMSALTLALAFATKETSFIVVAILGGYLLIVAAADWIPWLLRKPGITNGQQSLGYGEYRYWAGYGYAYEGPRTSHSLTKFSRLGIFLILIATLTAPQISAIFSLLQGVFTDAGIILADTRSPVGAPSGDLLFTLQDIGVTKGMAIAALVTIATIWFSALVGITWDRRVWLRCAAIFYSVWFLLYTTFFTNMMGAGSGIWQSLGYWIVQQGVNRGDQPWYYYIVITPIYETLPLIFSIAATVYYTIKGNNFTRFLIYWAVMTFIVYSIAGERMPWLTVNIVLPMIVLSAKFIGDMLSSLQWRRVLKAYGLYLLPITALVLYLLARLLLYPIERGNFVNFLEFWVLLGIALTMIGLWFHLLIRSGVSNGLKITSISIAVVFLMFTLRTGWQASYKNSDVPVEMLVYAQDSQDVIRIMDKVIEVGRKTGDRENLSLTVDKDIYWGLVWYLRHFDNVDYSDIGQITEPQNSSVILISAGNREEISQHLFDYTEGEEFLYIWWPAEGYKPCDTKPTEPCFSMVDIFTNITSVDKWKEGWDYFVYRKTDVDFLYHKAIVYFHNDVE